MLFFHLNLFFYFATWFLLPFFSCVFLFEIGENTAFRTHIEHKFLTMMKKKKTEQREGDTYMNIKRQQMKLEC